MNKVLSIIFIVLLLSAAAIAQVALSFGANDLDGTITDGGELTHSYSVESNNEVKMSKADIVRMIESAGFEAVERDTVYNRVAAV